MNVQRLAIPCVMLIERRVFGDHRSFFFESFNHWAPDAGGGGLADFVQDNHFESATNTLRGRHHHIRQPEGKLVSV
ncbi:dTDP-4-dehydrorhamnose 3,5-epimerase family protein [Rhizobium sp. SAFR-030]|uniref:dTDP-4-dehydrorhamnose 3,5-epimerase family protein n=1 Tax=Rhizobium sp. SAFR-030 TaxID=3387277 RepID=UPI003F7EAF15